MSKPGLLAARVRLSDDAVFRDLDGEAVILNLATGVYFGLDVVGTRIWHLLAAAPPLRQVVAAIVDEFDVNPAECARDLEDFVDALRGHDLVVVEPEPAR